MKKIILITISIIATILLSVFIVNKVKSELLKIDIANSIKDFLNEGKYCKYFGDYQLDWLETAKRGNVNNYDVTEFVKYFIKISKKSIETRLGMNNDKEYEAYKKILQTHYKEISIVSMCYWYYKYFDNYITETDIELYKNNKLEEKIIEDLGKKLNYHDGKWYINGNESKQIELLYGFYLNYTPDNRVEKVKPKKILDVKVLNKNLSKISYDKDRSIDILIKYINDEDNIIECTNKISIHVRDKEHLNVESLSILYYTYPDELKFSRLEIHHHSKDAEDAEYREWEREKIKAEEERDSSTIIDHWDVRIIDRFKKYSDQPALQVDYMEDGSINAYIRLYMPIEKDGVIINEYKKRKLPYKENMPIEKVMEKYLSDEEQISADEKFLKDGESSFEYETVIIN